MPQLSEQIKDRWLETLLPRVSQAGWTQLAAGQAARDAGLSPGEQALAAPNGVADLIDHLFVGATGTMRATLHAQDLTGMRTHHRVGAGVWAWLQALEPHKPAVRKAAGRGLLPWGASAATKQVWAIADAVWDAAGDTATDYNRQTKRLLLGAVIPAIVLYWLDHDEPRAVQDFIAKRLQNAMKLGQTGSKILAPVLDFTARFRRPEKSRDL